MLPNLRPKLVLSSLQTLTAALARKRVLLDTVLPLSALGTMQWRAATTPMLAVIQTWNLLRRLSVWMIPTDLRLRWVQGNT